MGESVCRIEKHTNGFEVSCRDPEIVKANQKRDAMKYDDPKRGQWQDPNQTFVFKTADEVLKFLKTNLPKLVPEPDYDTSFDIASNEID